MGNSLQTAQTVEQVVTILASVLQLGSNLGLDLGAVSSAIALAQSQGRALSADELKQFVAEWDKADKAEQSAYDKATGKNA